MDTLVLFHALVARLEGRLASQRGASLDAADYASHFPQEICAPVQILSPAQAIQFLREDEQEQTRPE